MSSLKNLRRRMRKVLPIPRGEDIHRIKSHFLRRLRLGPAYTPHYLIDHPGLVIKSPLAFVVADHILKKGSLRFLQIGAFDGDTCDDLAEIIRDYDCVGVLVEPQPIAFEKLQKKYSESEKVRLINAAIDCESGERDFFMPSNQSSLVASFDRNHLLKHGVSSRDIICRKIPCKTVTDILNETQFDSFDLIQIDAEGHDYQIIKSILREKVYPAILRFEIAHFVQRDMTKCLDLLASHGYQFHLENKDLLAIGTKESIKNPNLSLAS